MAFSKVKSLSLIYDVADGYVSPEKKQCITFTIVPYQPRETHHANHYKKRLQNFLRRSTVARKLERDDGAFTAVHCVA